MLPRRDQMLEQTAVAVHQGLRLNGNAAGSAYWRMYENWRRRMWTGKDTAAALDHCADERKIDLLRR